MVEEILNDQLSPPGEVLAVIVAPIRGCSVPQESDSTCESAETTTGCTIADGQNAPCQFQANRFGLQQSVIDLGGF